MTARNSAPVVGSDGRGGKRRYTGKLGDRVLVSASSPPSRACRPAAIRRAPATANPTGTNVFPEAGASQGVPLGQPRHLLDERAGAAVDVDAEEPADQATPPRPAAPRPADPPDAVGSICAAPRADTRLHRRPPRPPRPRMGGDHHRAVDSVDAVDHHRRQMRKQNLATALPATISESTTQSRLGFTQVRQKP